LKEGRKQYLNNGVKIPYQGKISPPSKEQFIRFFMEEVVEEKIYVGTNVLQKGHLH
jgi:hypothetical protein